MAQHTLQTIPAELRNNIYELAFTSDQEGPIEFCKAAPPSNALLLACKQIHNEAVQIYRAAYHRYWSTSEFVIDILESDLTDDEKVWGASTRWETMLIEYIGRHTKNPPARCGAHPESDPDEPHCRMEIGK